MPSTTSLPPAGARFEITQSMAAEPARDARPRKTLAQLRDLREQATQRNAVEQARRQVEDHIRDERHDASAKTIVAGEFTERRRYRSDKELRRQRDELQREWESRQRRQIRQMKR